MARVREEHSHLQAVLGTLNQKISGVLSKQEGDFIAAYRAHMYTVQKELQTLRYGVDYCNTDQTKVALLAKFASNFNSCLHFLCSAELHCSSLKVELQIAKDTFPL
jgi:hypothetical protein